MSDHSIVFKEIETNVIHAGRPQPNIEGAVVTPIFQSANYLAANEESYDAVRYIRSHNSPNHITLHHRLASLENAEAALVTSSGMAAISSAIISTVGSGGHILVHKTLYGGTATFLQSDSASLGFEFSQIDITSDSGADEWKKALRPNSRAIYVESITNPLMEVGDLKAVVSFAREHNLVAMIDNTFPSPVNFRPLDIGYDIVLHSATKYLNGHSDIVAGVVVGSREQVEKVHHLQLHLGAALDPHACFLLERGLKTLVLRVRQQNANALKLAKVLQSHPSVEKVMYPGLESDPGHSIAKELFDGFGGMLSFYTNNARGTERLIERMRIPTHAASLGGTETLVIQPSRSSHLGLSPEEREKLGITDNLVRVSTGIENIDELISDFEQALG